MGIDIKQHLTPPMLLVIFLVIVSLMIVFPVLNMIILGAILAYGIKPVAHKIQSKLKFSSISILLAMVVVLIPLILLIAYIVTELIFISQAVKAGKIRGEEALIQHGGTVLVGLFLHRDIDIHLAAKDAVFQNQALGQSLGSVLHWPFSRHRNS